VQRCRGCGACAPDLSTLPAAAAAVTATPAYQALTSRFLRWAALAPEAEAEALLQAAWEAEDADADGRDLRRQAAAAWPTPDDAEARLRLADTLRRAGDMAAASAHLDALGPMPDDGLARIASFERARIAAGDTGRHLLSSALRPPARTPHVAHGKPARTGFWGKLFGAPK
jgi:hypothetical protein